MTKEEKINKDIVVKFTEDNTHIINSYLITSHKEIKEQLKIILKQRKDLNYPIKRTFNSYKREWVAHNNLYHLYLFRNHTKDVDLDENVSLFYRLIWFIIGR